MNISDFYNNLLLAKGFTIIDQATLLNDYSKLKMPIENVRLSWHNAVPRPIVKYSNSFLAMYPDDLETIEYRGEKLSDLVTRWMSLMPGTEKYLVSLNESNYLFTVSNKIKVDDVLCVANSWNIDCFLGVFDDSQTMMFVFDVEFGVVYFSFDPSHIPEGYDRVAEHYCKQFEKEFVQDAEIRTGADADRVLEYYQKVYVQSQLCDS